MFARVMLARPSQPQLAEAHVPFLELFPARVNSNIPFMVTQKHVAPVVAIYSQTVCTHVCSSEAQVATRYVKDIGTAMCCNCCASIDLFFVF